MAAPSGKVALAKSQGNSGLKLTRFNPTRVARLVLLRPDIQAELFRLLAWLSPEQLDAAESAIAHARRHRADVLGACADGTFGEKYVLHGND